MKNPLDKLLSLVLWLRVAAYKSISWLHCR